VADSMLSVAEAARDALALENEAGGHKPRGPLPIGEYVKLATSPEESARAFASIVYHAFRSCALRFGARKALISEMDLERARRVFAAGLRTRASGELLAAPTPEAVPLCAALAVALANAKPIKQIDFESGRSDRAPHFADDPNVFVACAVGLSAYIAAADQSDPDAVLAVAEAAIETHFLRLRSALRSPDPVAGVAGEFASIVCFL